METAEKVVALAELVAPVAAEAVVVVAKGLPAVTEVLEVVLESGAPTP